MHSIADRPEGFALIEARVLALWAHEFILVPGTKAVDPSRWLPLIFSYQSYRSPMTELGRMETDGAQSARRFISARAQVHSQHNASCRTHPLTRLPHLSHPAHSASSVTTASIRGFARVSDT
ncbi:MAG: hypothetical protein CBARDMAM_2837 [uncultured Caballeronia sp.]|nr:MAG: hypothetical protein CBARDMAM_2837 [uncultured Caballeronia sp.]